MADEVQQPTTTSPEPVGAPAPEERVGAALERAAERSGVDLGAGPAPQPDRPATGVQTPERAISAAGPGLDGDRATAALREKLDVKRQARYLRVLEQVAERAVQESERSGAPTTEAPAAPAAATNPYDRETQYWDWYDWEQKALRDGISSSFDEKLKPVLAFVERQQQADAAQAEAQRRAQTDRSWWEERAALAREAHDTYAATEEGKDYMARTLFMVGHPGSAGDPARGIPAQEPIDGALSIAWMTAGIDPQTARELAAGHVHGVTEIAQRRGLNPAVMVDRFNRGLIAAVAEYLLPAGAGDGRATATPAVTAAAPPSAAKRRAQANRQVASSAVTGSVAEAGAGGGGDLKTSLAQLASEGRLGTTEMRELAGRFFPKRGPVEAMKSLRKVLAEMGAESAAAAAGN